MLFKFLYLDTSDGLMFFLPIQEMYLGKQYETPAQIDCDSFRFCLKILSPNHSILVSVWHGSKGVVYFQVVVFVL